MTQLCQILNYDTKVLTAIHYGPKTLWGHADMNEEVYTVVTLPVRVIR